MDFKSVSSTGTPGNIDINQLLPSPNVNRISSTLIGKNAKKLKKLNRKLNRQTRKQQKKEQRAQKQLERQNKRQQKQKDRQLRRQNRKNRKGKGRQKTGRVSGNPSTPRGSSIVGGQDAQQISRIPGGDSSIRRVVGGTDAQSGWNAHFDKSRHVPWQAGIRRRRWRNSLETFALCGGTIIYDRIIVTAAHCFTQHSA